MKKTLTKSISFCMLGILMLSCKKEEPMVETDPQKIILGRWEIIEIGNWSNMEPTTATGYTEFTVDSVTRFYDYELKQFTAHGKYWVSDTVIFNSQTREDGFEIITRRKLEFFNKNQNLRLDHLDLLAIFNSAIYKRIK